MSPESNDNVIPLSGNKDFAPQERDAQEELASRAVQAVGPEYAERLLELCKGISHESGKNIIATAAALTEKGHPYENIHRILVLQANRYRAHS